MTAPEAEDPRPELTTGPLRVFDLFNPGRPDLVLEAEVAAHHAAYDDPRSYDAKKAWRDAHPDQPSPVRRTGSVLGPLLKALAPEPDLEAEI
jgi:hypothetical protein